MYLKGLDVNGFKSFADKINLEFGQGITAIVGPNGSGKSNVSDAIRWVLGEQSVKSLRGSRMEDIIFAGTQKRSPMGFAQVSISFDNKDRFFDSEADEIKVTRKLHRSGESEYRLNNVPCRLKDVHELFMDTGLGREGYSVIGQGKIDQILSNKAEDRRNIFEEASGITKYKYRKAEAEKKLVAADDNLLRIKDLISALSDQVEPLEAQSKKARQYLDLREILKGLEINLSVRNIDKLRQALADGQEKYHIVFNHLSSEKEKLADIENAIELKTDEQNKLNDEINAVREELFNVEKGSGSLESRIEILQNDKKNNDENNAGRLSEIDVLKQRVEAADNRKNEIDKRLKELAEKKGKAEENISVLTARLNEFDADISACLEKTEAIKSEIVELLGGISSLKAKSSSMDVLLKNFDERKETLISDLENKRNLKAEMEKRIENIRKESNENSAAADKAKSDMEQLKKEYFEIAEKLDEAKKDQNAIVTRINNKESRRSVLEELEKNYDGYAKSVKAILNLKMSGVDGVVSKLLKVDEQYTTAIEIALGGALQNIVVENEDVAKKCIYYLKSNKIGRATFLPLTSVRGEILKNPPSGEKGYVGIASELIDCSVQYEGIFRSLLGRTVVADNIDNAAIMAKNSGYRLRIVTLDGQVMNPGGSMTGGSSGSGSGLLSRSRDIEKLRVEINALNSQADKKDDEISGYKDTVNSMAAAKQGLEDIIRKCEHEDVRLSSQLSADKKALADISASIEMLTNESGDIVSEIADIDSQKAVFADEIRDKEELIRLRREALSQIEEKGSELAAQREALSEEMTAEKIGSSADEKDYRIAVEEKCRLESDSDTYRREIEEKKSDISAAKERNTAIDEEIAAIRQKITDTESSSKDLYDCIERGQTRYDEMSGKLKSLRAQLKEQNGVIYDLQQEVIRLENKNAKTEADIENVINKLWEDYELTYNAALEMKKSDFNITAAQKEALSIRSKIKALGNINIDSIEQYKEVKEKFDYLTEQKKDLDETKSKLEDIIKEMQSVMITQFNETFSAIKDSFGATFTALFGGGTGRLSLTEPGNVLESGIEIEVQPPGKKLSNMMALSGGERALSAIALLFAVLDVKPTPFCILDEVEAALDDNNVYRFADYIKRYSRKTQFIVVTHRRGTMEAADIMYGVTMQEKGISKLLKLKFEDLEDYSTDGA